MKKLANFLAFMLLAILLLFPAYPSEKPSDYAQRLASTVDTYFEHPQLITLSISNGWSRVSSYTKRISSRFQSMKATYKHNKSNYKAYSEKPFANGSSER